ncbi:MAG TPA: hypothetical protein PKA77_16650 [Chitinophagaceae bacterium]|nr:hypothetical protein [Chitinophagaceae bacterium]
MKIENVIDSCHECRYMQKVQEVGGNTFFAGICIYGSYKGNMDNPHPFTVVATSTNKDVFNQSITIPDNCPLETFGSTCR